MSKFFVCLIVYIIFSSPKVISQELNLCEFDQKIKRSKVVKKYFIDKSSNDYLHLDFLQGVKKLILEEFSLDDFCNDSIVFVEIYGRESSGYFCSIFKSKDKIISYYSKRSYPITIEVLEDKTSADYIIEEVRKGNLIRLLEKGATSKLHPESHIYITIAILKGNEYDIKSYSTKFFLFKDK